MSNTSPSSTTKTQSPSKTSKGSRPTHVVQLIDRSGEETTFTFVGSAWAKDGGKLSLIVDADKTIPAGAFLSVRPRKNTSTKGAA